MVIGIGLDLVETARVERALARYGERFVAQAHGPGGGARAAAFRPRARALPGARRRGQGGGEQGPRDGLEPGRALARRGRLPSARRPRVRLDGRAAEVARELGSSGRGHVRLEIRGPLAVGEFWLLS